MPEAEINGIIAKNINKFLARNGKTQVDLAAYMGVSQATVSNWCKGLKMPRMDKIDKICAYFKVYRSELMEDNAKTPASALRQAIAIPVYGHVTAGNPLEMPTDIIDTEEIPAEMTKNGKFFGLQIHDQTMEPRIKSGDVVIVRAQEDAKNDDLVIVAVNDTDAICKRLKKYADGIALISANPAYEPMYFSTQEIQEKPVRILGKVVELRAKF